MAKRREKGTEDAEAKNNKKILEVGTVKEKNSQTNEPSSLKTEIIRKKGWFVPSIHGKYLAG